MFTQRRISQITNLALLTAAALLFAMAANATTFTAVASGDWSSSATWGGSSVGSDISAHTVIIPPGITVNMDSDVLMNGSSSNLDVNGTLQGSAHTLTVIEGDVSGVGSIVVNRIEAESNADITFTGSLEANTFINSGAQLALTCIQTVHDTLQLSGGMFVVSSASLTLDQNSEIVMNGGTFSVTSGTLIASNSYNVTYQGNSTSIGLEASGSGLNDLNCNLSNSNGQLSLSSDVQLGGELTIIQGQVVVGSNSLTVNGGLTTNNGSGMLDVSSQSSLTINGDVSGGLNFGSSSATIGDLTLNLGSSNSASLGSDLQVNGSFDHQSGTCALNDHSLSVMGDFNASGTAMFEGSSNSNLMIETSGNVDGWISFSSGNEELDSCSFDFPSSDTITIGSDLMVGSSFDFESGHVALSSNTTLDANGQVSFGSQGMFVGTSDANIEIHSSGSANGELQFGSGSETIGNLTIDASSNGNVALGSDAGVNGSLDLQNGVLVINDNTLMINGDVSGSGSGTIQGSSSSNIEIHSSGSLSGGLSFESGSEEVNDFTIDIGSNGSASIESDLSVNGELDLQNGYVMIGNNDLTIESSGSITGGSNSSYVMTNGNGSLGIMVDAGGSGTFYPVGTSVSFAPATLTQASGSANGMFSVSAMSGVLVNGSSGSNMAPFTSMVDNTWFIESELNSNIDLSATFEWASSMEVNSFDNTDCYISHYTNAAWDVAATASANVNTSGRFEISRSGFTSLSPFAVFDSGTSVGTPEVAEVEYELFPNPVKDRLRYTIKGTEGSANIDLFDNNGRLINSFQVNRQSGSINVSDLPAGYYTIRISDGESEKYSKLIKQ